MNKSYILDLPFVRISLTLGRQSTSALIFFSNSARRGGY